jgi:hypothetical protein
LEHSLRLPLSSVFPWTEYVVRAWWGPHQDTFYIQVYPPLCFFSSLLLFFSSFLLFFSFSFFLFFFSFFLFFFSSLLLFFSPSLSFRLLCEFLFLLLGVLSFVLEWNLRVFSCLFLSFSSSLLSSLSLSSSSSSFLLSQDIGSKSETLCFSQIFLCGGFSSFFFFFFFFFFFEVWIGCV